MELGDWIDEQAQLSAELMSRAISATHLQRVRAQFSQVVVPARGSVLASPAIADWTPEPDYFFHWVRDSAIVMRTVTELVGRTLGESGRWTACFHDYVAFSLGLTRLDTRGHESHVARTEAAFRQFLRADDDIRALARDALLGEPRFNPDGTIDILGWSRPQYDGPALRALACLRFRDVAGASADLDALLRLDLDFTARHAGEPCIGPWEEPEENTHHYYVALVQLGALVHGRAVVRHDDAEARLRAVLARHWSAEPGVYAALWPLKAQARDDLVDSAALLAVLDADLAEGPHSVADPRVWQTLAALEALFASEFPINRGRAAPALGRSRADRYFGGGAWYVATLAAAALCYRRAGRDHDAAFFARGDAFMATVRDLIPAGGHMGEQVDRNTGKPASARDLTWSYAAFIGAAGLRQEALRRLAARS
ncbi:MAG: glycoside hydrolase family 15 protein [Pseudolabrys sp.]